MKRLCLLLLAVLATAAIVAVSAAAAHVPTSKTAYAATEHSINLVLAGSPGEDRITIELSADGRSYEVESATPLEVGGTVCTHPEKVPTKLLCEAAPIAGFEINTGAGDDVVTLGRTVPAPATIRGGDGDPRRRHRPRAPDPRSLDRAHGLGERNQHRQREFLAHLQHLCAHEPLLSRRASVGVASRRRVHAVDEENYN